MRPPRSQIIYKLGQRKSKIPVDKRKKRAILQSRSKKGKVKNDLWKGGRQAWVFPISSPGLSSRSWRRPAARWSFSAAIWHSDSTACPVRSTMSCPPAFPPSTATLWSRGGAAAATSASRGCQVDRQTLLMHVINSVGDTLDYASARAITQNLVDSEAVSRELGQALLAAVGERALRTVPKERRSALRADIFKQILIHSV